VLHLAAEGWYEATLLEKGAEPDVMDGQTSLA
jgi:hypothetical protein